MSETIAICMAAYNGARFLPGQLDSIAAQSHRAWHLHVRDDGSQDATRDILEAFRAAHPDRVTIHDDALGRIGARDNFACLMARVREPYITFADQDDVWRPWKLGLLLARMRRDEMRHGPQHPRLVHGDRRVIDAAGQDVAPSYWASRGIDAGAFDFGRSLSFCLAAGAAMLINRPLLDRALPIPSEARMYDTWLELVAHGFGTVTALDEIVLDWRRHGGNVSGSAGDNTGPAARRPWARARRLFGNLDRQRAVYRGYAAQATVFRARFGRDLCPATMRQLDGFLGLGACSPVGRFRRARRYDVAPPGLARLAAFAMLGAARPGPAGIGRFSDRTAPS